MKDDSEREKEAERERRNESVVETAQLREEVERLSRELQGVTEKAKRKESADEKTMEAKDK